MKFVGFLAALAALAISTIALSAERATRDEAKAYCMKAAAHYRDIGAVKAFADFQTSAWRDRELYVLGVNNDGIQVVHGANPAMVGRNVIDMRDVDGKLTNREMLAVKEEGWVEYQWHNPASGSVEAKATYVIRVSPDTILAVGAYKPN